MLERAELPHCGTHAVRHRAATDIANSGVPVKVGMALTAHKTVSMSMRYVQTENDPIRTAAETVAARRRQVVTVAPDMDAAPDQVDEPQAVSILTTAPNRTDAARPGPRPAPGPTKTAMGNYRPYRVRRDETRLRRRGRSTWCVRRRFSMSECRNPDARWPAAEIMRRARHVDDTGLIPFVDTKAAARYLALSPHSLECYRSLGGKPPFYKHGRFVRYAVRDLQDWTEACRHERTAGGNTRIY